MDTFRNMQAFAAVARLGGFSAAARELKVATSVVTKRIDQFEWRTKTTLFHRSTRQVRLTEVGAVWLPKVEAAIEAVEEVLIGMSASKGTLHGRIRIKVPTTLTLFYLSALLLDFQSMHPAIVLDLVLNDRLVNPVEEDFDIVIAGIPGTFRDVVETGLCQSRLVLCASPDYLRRHGRLAHPKELESRDILLFGPFGTSWTFESEGGHTTVDVKPKFTANDGQVILAAATAGKGIAMLAHYTVAPSMLDGKLVQVLGGFPIQPHLLRAIVPTLKAGWPRLQELILHLKASLNPLPPWEKVWPAEASNGQTAQKAPRKRSTRKRMPEIGADASTG